MFYQRGGRVQCNEQGAGLATKLNERTTGGPEYGTKAAHSISQNGATIMVEYISITMRYEMKS